MRGFAKAAAFLSWTLASALVIPDSPSSVIRRADPTVEYRQSEALLTFQLSTPIGSVEWPFLTFQVDTAEEFCGGDDISLNGQRLSSHFRDESRAEGRGPLYFEDSTAEIYASWQITCLADLSHVDGVQVLTLVVENQDRASGFTISYRAFHTPQILQFDPYPTDLDTIEKNGIFWRTPSKFTRDVSTSTSNVVGKKTTQPANGQQKSLSFHSLGDLIGNQVEAVKNVASKALKSCRHHFPAIHSMFDKISQHVVTFFCPRQHGSQHALHEFITGSARIPSDATLIPLPDLGGAPLAVEKASKTSDESLDATSNLRPSSTPARSLDSPHASGVKSDSQILNSSPDELNQRLDHLKTLGLAVVLIAFFVWVYKRLTDPRRRADRAAVREERRRRCLYRRAAQIQKLRNWFGNLRQQYCPLNRPVCNCDEKQALVSEQLEIMETVRKNEMRALRHAHRVGCDVDAAEEGRNQFVYETDSRSERRRSMTTLPGYESEGTQPPGYESDALSVSDTFQYTPVESEDTPDSSVISTSPRISRDGRDSDFGKDIVSDWRLESTPLYSFRSIDV